MQLKTQQKKKKQIEKIRISKCQNVIQKLFTHRDTNTFINRGAPINTSVVGVTHGDDVTLKPC